MSKIFISHSSQNNAEALAIAQWLEQRENGWGDYFLDLDPKRGLMAGERWQSALAKVADRCEAVVFLISPAWLASKWCLAEFLQTKQLGKVIFGVLIEPVPLDAIPREMTMEWQLCDLVKGVERKTFRVAHDPLVPPTNIDFPAAGLAQLRRGLKKAGLDPALFDWPPKNDPERVPYRGFRALEAEDAAIFFGREAAIVSGLDRLRNLRDQGIENLMVILGASGAGKSSFMRAGLLPRLERDDRHFYPLPPVRPERAVLSGASGLAASLEDAFKALKQPRSRGELLRQMQESGGFARALRDLRDRRPAAEEKDAPPPVLILPIDQGEELFIPEGRAEAERFLALLAGVLAPPDEGTPPPRLIALLTIRSDSYHLLQTEPALAAVKSAPFDLKPLASAELKAVIEGPAERSRRADRPLKIDPRLTEKLTSGEGGADVLPLLAFALERLYLEHAGDGELTVEEYEGSGGLKGMVNAAIDGAFADPGRAPAVPADEAERNRAVRAAFVPWLARLDPETGKPKRRLARWDDIPEGSRGVVERLIEQRLLLKDTRELEPGQPPVAVVEIAHEALLRQWAPLVGWLAEAGDRLRLAEAVKRAAADWLAHGRNEDLLVHKGDYLRQAEDLRAQADFLKLLGDTGSAYLAACRQREDAKRERERRLQVEREENLQKIEEQQKSTAKAQRRTKWLIAATAAVVVFAGGWIFQQGRDVNRLMSHTLTEQASTYYKEKNVGQAFRAALWAVTLHDGLTEHKARTQLAQAHKVGYLPKLWLEDSGGGILDVAFAPDGRRLVGVGADGAVRVWDTGSGHLRAIWKGDGAKIAVAALNSEGSRAFMFSKGQGARLRDTGTGQWLLTLQDPRQSLRSAVFSPDGRRVVAWSPEKRAWVWETTSGRLLATLDSHAGAINGAAFSPDSQRVVTASDDKTAIIWDAANGKKLRVLRHHEAPVRTAAFSPDGEWIVTASQDTTAEVWDTQSGAPRVSLPGHSKGLTLAIFSPDGQRVVTASWDNTARIWDFSKSSERAEVAELRRNRQTAVRDVAYSPNGKYIVTASGDATAGVWDAVSGQHLASLGGPGEDIDHVRFSPDGSLVLTVDHTGSLSISAMGEVQRDLVLQGHDGMLRDAAFSPNGRQVATGSLDRTVRVWDSNEGKPLATHPGHEDTVNSVAFSPDGSRLVTSSADHTARIWDTTPSGSSAITLAGHELDVSGAAFSPDGRLVVTASFDRSEKIWDAATGNLLKTLAGHVGQVNSAAFSPDGQRIVTASTDGTARIWNVASGQEVGKLQVGRGVFSAAYNRDGTQIVTGSRDRIARIWDAAGGMPLAEFKGHTDDISTVEFSPDGHWVVTAGDRTARLWNARTGQHLADLEGHNSRVSSARFSPDGQWVVTASEDNTARVWSVGWLGEAERPDLDDYVCRLVPPAAHRITAADLRDLPILIGREGEDACHPPSLPDRAWRALRALLAVQP